MKRSSLWYVSVVTTPEAEDAVSELLGAMLGQPVSSYFDLETGLSTVKVYCLGKPSPAAWRADLRAGLDRIKRCGLKTGSGKIAIAKVRREDWAESGSDISSRLKSVTRCSSNPAGARNVPARTRPLWCWIPALSFGTGQHPTTAFCLHELSRGGKNGARCSFLDIGTGSGILAIAAAKLGFSPVHAFDFDPDSVRIARANARANGVLNQVRIMRRCDQTAD